MAASRILPRGETISDCPHLHSAAWQKQSRRLQRNGFMLKFKLGTKIHTSSSHRASCNPRNLLQPLEQCLNRDIEDEELLHNNGNLDLVNLSNNREYDEGPMMCVQIGGLREDPFRMFPMEHQDYVPSAFDYCKRGVISANNSGGRAYIVSFLDATIYLPFAARQATPTQDFHAVYFQILLQQPLRFEAIIAFSLAMQTLHHVRDSRMSKAILYHSNRATATLRQMLLSGTDITSDEVILTIMVLFAIAHFTGHSEALEVHIRGLKRIVALRGGVENLLGLRGYIKMGVTQVLGAWTARQRMLECKQQSSRAEEMEIKLVYPAHPFPPRLCQKITRLSVGFRELAISRKLSLQFIDFVHLTVSSARDSGQEAGALSTTADEVLGRSKLTTLERVLGTALTAYNVYVERNLTSPNPSYGLYVQSQFRVLTARSDVLSCDADGLAWACLMLRATTEKDSDSWRWADLRLQVMQLSESRQRELGETFIQIPLAASVVDPELD